MSIGTGNRRIEVPRLLALLSCPVGLVRQRRQQSFFGGIPHLREGKGGKMRFVPTHPGTLTLIEEYLEAAGHGRDQDARK